MTKSDLFCVQNLNDKISDAQVKLQLLQQIATSLKSPADISSAHSTQSFKTSPFENIAVKVLEQQSFIQSLQLQAFNATNDLIKKIQASNLSQLLQNVLIYHFALDKSVEEIADIIHYSRSSTYRFLKQAVSNFPNWLHFLFFLCINNFLRKSEFFFRRKILAKIFVGWQNGKMHFWFCQRKSGGRIRFQMTFGKMAKLFPLNLFPMKEKKEKLWKKKQVFLYFSFGWFFLALFQYFFSKSSLIPHCAWQKRMEKLKIGFSRIKFKKALTPHCAWQKRMEKIFSKFCHSKKFCQKKSPQKSVEKFFTGIYLFFSGSKRNIIIV